MNQKNESRIPKNLELNKNEKNDYDFIMDLVEKDGDYLKFASKKLKNDYKIVYKAVETSQKAVLKFASNELKDNFEIVLAAVKNNYHSLQFCSEKLKNNFEIVYHHSKECNGFRIRFR
jgi:ribosomal protein L24E